MKNKTLITTIAIICAISLAGCGENENASGTLGEIVVDENNDSYGRNVPDESLDVEFAATEQPSIQDETISSDNTPDPGVGGEKEVDVIKEENTLNNTAPEKKEGVPKKQTKKKSDLEIELDGLKPDKLYEWYKKNIYDAYSETDEEYIKKKEEYYNYISVRYITDGEMAEYFDKNVSDLSFDTGFVYEVNMQTSKERERAIEEENKKIQEEKSNKKEEQPIPETNVVNPKNQSAKPTKRKK